MSSALQAPSRPVSKEERDAYEQDGAVCLRGLFDSSWVDRLREATARSMGGPGAMVREYDTNKGGRFHANMFLWRVDPDVRAFVFESPAAQIAADLMGAHTVSFFYDHLLVKEPGTANPTPWHQDLPYWPVQGDQICSLWFALDHVDLANGGVRYVAGSHRWSDAYRAQSFDMTDKYDDGSLPAAPNPDEMDVTVLNWDLEPGDVVAHHARTLHGAFGNQVTDRRRRGLATRWFGDDAVYAPRPKTMPLPEDPGLPAGARLRCALFPVVLEQH